MDSMTKKIKNANLRLELGNFCYLGGITTPRNPITIHEIYPQRCGGIRIYTNTALLCRLEHDMNNAIERERPKFGRELADYYHYIRESRDIEALKQMREEVLKQIERMGYEVEDKGHILTLKRKKEAIWTTKSKIRH